MFKFYTLLFLLGFSFSFSHQIKAEESEEEEVEEESESEDKKEEIKPASSETIQQETEIKTPDIAPPSLSNTKYEDYEDEKDKVTINPNLNERVKHFDIVGVKLGLTYAEIKKILKSHKYKLTNIEYNIPEYFTFNYDAICRKQNIFISENLKACIKGQAKKNKMEYISKVSYKKHDTKEDLDIYFTSPITQNRIWKIEYKNDANIKYGDAKNFQYQQEENRRSFWYYVTMKYGKPTTPPNKWVYDSGDEHTITLTATFDSLTLVNPKQNAYDILEATKQARREFSYTKYTF